MDWLRRLCRIVHAILSISKAIRASHRTALLMHKELSFQHETVGRISYCMHKSMCVSVWLPQGLWIAVKGKLNFCHLCVVSLCNPTKKHTFTRVKISNALTTVVHRLILDFRISLIANMFTITHSTDSVPLARLKLPTKSQILLITGEFNVYIWLVHNVFSCS